MDNHLHQDQVPNPKYRHENTYKFMYSDIDNYVNRISTMLNQNHKLQSNIMKKNEHTRIVYDLKANFLSFFSSLF